MSQQPIAIQAALNSLLLTKALSASAIATRNATLHSDRYPHLKPHIDQIQQLTAQINSLDYGDPNRPKILSQIDQIQQQINQQTTEIALPRPDMVDRNAIALQLPDSSTLIEFIKFNLFDKNQTWSDTRYLAFILPKTDSDQVQMIDLGSAQPIDDLIAICYSAITEDFPNTDSAVVGKRSKTTIPAAPICLKTLPQLKTSRLSTLQQKIIAPLLPHIHSDHLILAPDGALFRLPFNLLLPDHHVTYLTTGRDLVRPASNKPAGRSLIFAHPDFDHAAPQLSLVPSLPAASQFATAGIKDLANFTKLDEFGVLGKAIALQVNAQYHEQRAATKSIVVNSNCPHILSILTHGFAIETTPDQDPMSYTGLAFSGASHSSQNLLLANEIATLNLHSNSLTLLVACQTALGHIQPGEEVYGLRRAFAIAGSKTLIATLWEIPVLASIVLIERFFANLQDHMGKSAALIEAQDYLRTRTVADLQATSSGNDALTNLANYYDLTGVEYPFAHPYFWAAWICQGETTPMDYVGTAAIGKFNIGDKLVNLHLKQ
jgi:CHAT domain-containing protein